MLYFLHNRFIKIGNIIYVYGMLEKKINYTKTSVVKNLMPSWLHSTNASVHSNSNCVLLDTCKLQYSRVIKHLSLYNI